MAVSAHVRRGRSACAPRRVRAAIADESAVAVQVEHGHQIALRLDGHRVASMVHRARARQRNARVLCRTIPNEVGGGGKRSQTHTRKTTATQQRQNKKSQMKKVQRSQTHTQKTTETRQRQSFFLKKKKPKERRMLPIRPHNDVQRRTVHHEHGARL